MTDTTVSPAEAVEEPKAPVVVPALKNAGSHVASGAHVVGSHVADANLRSLGKGLKSLGRRLPRVRIERPDAKS